jgi:hypothetical protein
MRTVRKRRAKRTLKEGLVQQGKGMTDNPSGVVESRQKHRLAKTKTLKATIALWNDFNAKMGSFSDDYGD